MLSHIKELGAYIDLDQIAMIRVRRSPKVESYSVLVTFKGREEAILESFYWGGPDPTDCSTRKEALAKALNLMNLIGSMRAEKSNVSGLTAVMKAVVFVAEAFAGSMRPCETPMS